MSKWQQVKLNDCCASISDGDHQAPPKSESGIPFVTISNIDSYNSLDFSNVMYVPQMYYDKLDNKRKAQKGDIIYSVVGSFGLPVLIKDNTPFVFQRHIAILKPGDDLDSRFLYYTMLNKDFYHKADAVAIGAAQRTISLTALRNLEISLPPIEEQRKIADVLSAYDDLIENNRKQIKLLEEAAQRLYKEWFIDLRFPGHENTPIIDGVPEGWELTNLGTLGAFVRGKTITKDQTCSGNIPVVAGGLTPAYYHNAHNTDVPVITVSGSGANAGFTNMYFQKIWASDCSYLEKSKTQGFFFVYCFLKSNQEILDNLQKGSAQPHVYAKDINAIAFYKPQDNVFQNFEYKTSSMFEQIANLQTSIKKATETRDRLLPKLMNGELEVD